MSFYLRDVDFCHRFGSTKYILILETQDIEFIEQHTIPDAPHRAVGFLLPIVNARGWETYKEEGSF